MDFRFRGNNIKRSMQQHRLDRGFQFKILKLLVFFIVFWIPWSATV
ncbi:MAG TPA: hypothetical protein LFV92_00745 [Rickettsia endosymbiont of Ceroptres masudai]|nr:hypothetical protein [Rickettsia endosymbiont of Ceroptres masudai]